ncbi:hypothetical protein GCM10009613_20300 [Pseudonocardia kongjuensis]|uniref:MaoC-like domain-containing protein n=1 Tax=Pseudonocardia kongjuensis TaxID=102227 RepID=A0ABP4IB59_9PSEU
MPSDPRSGGPGIGADPGPVPAGHLVTEREIVGFARQWDPRPFHLDRAEAATSVFGELVASGLHILAASYRQWLDAEGLPGAMAGLGLDRVRWLRPVRPGDTLRVTGSAPTTRPTATPGRDVARVDLTTSDQHGRPVMTATLVVLVGAAAPDGTAGPPTDQHTDR